MKIKRNIQRQARIEMVPLIDVVFLLLVFFIYAMLSMVVHRGIPINLPESKSALIDKKDYVSLSITKEGKVYLDKMPVCLEELKTLLIQKKKNNPNVKVFISGDKMVYYEKIITVLDIIRMSGLSKVSLETEFKD
ncbi:MAG: biopolymer transporter ExbD [Deltaproteobacteria bacterium]|nr:MAG: biopolymer transporter ExbD [Deltaproteobacteria bacterium]